MTFLVGMDLWVSGWAISLFISWPSSSSKIKSNSSRDISNLIHKTQPKGHKTRSLLKKKITLLNCSMVSKLFDTKLAWFQINRSLIYINLYKAKNSRSHKTQFTLTLICVCTSGQVQPMHKLMWIFECACTYVWERIFECESIALL